MWCLDELTHADACLGGCWGAATKQAAVRQGTGIPLTTGGISGDETIVRFGGSCQAAVGSLCCQATVAGCCHACPVLGGAKHRSALVTRSRLSK